MPQYWHTLTNLDHGKTQSHFQADIRHAAARVSRSICTCSDTCHRFCMFSYSWLGHLVIGRLARLVSLQKDRLSVWMRSSLSRCCSSGFNKCTRVTAFCAPLSGDKVHITSFLLSFSHCHLVCVPAFIPICDFLLTLQIELSIEGPKCCKKEAS